MADFWKRVEFYWDHNRQVAWTLIVLFFAVLLWTTLRPQSPGISIGVLALAAGIMSIRPKMGGAEKTAWAFMLVVFAILEVLAINRADEENRTARDRQNTVFQGIADSLKQELSNTSQLLSLERQSRAPAADGTSALKKESLVKAWGKVSTLPSKAVDGASATPNQPPQLQTSKRNISAEALGLYLKNKEHSAATIISDGTNEAGNFAKQMEIGLRFGGWIAGGDNIKIGDPQFFPDSLTVEVSAMRASTDDHSQEEANDLIAALKAQGVVATLRFTDLAFPPNFMRIKIAGQ